VSTISDRAGPAGSGRHQQGSAQVTVSMTGTARPTSRDGLAAAPEGAPRTALALPQRSGNPLSRSTPAVRAGVALSFFLSTGCLQP